MNQDKLLELRSRIERLRAKLSVNAASGFSYFAEVDGEKQGYQIIGVKNPVERKDEVANLMVWVWSMKDHLIKRLIENGMKKDHARDFIKTEIQESLELKICFDIANSEKHSGLDRPSWSGLYPEMLTGGFRAPHGSVREIMIGEDGITLEIAKPELVNFSLEVRDMHGNSLGDAVKILDVAIAKWESTLDKIV